MSSLEAYMRRIGAEQINFRTWMVKTYVGNYYREQALIRVAPDGTITAPEEYAPTREEAARIASDAATAPPLPTNVRANGRGSFVVPRGSVAGYDFWDQATGELIMIQIRVETPTGKKYLPFTLWSDGEWRCMEPDGPLPFWKPKKAISAKIMIHEGAKCAYYAEWLARDPSPQAKEARKKHPWALELAEYEHWGIIGGALATHRADWESLRRRGPAEVVFFCDNDAPGVEALVGASRAYRGRLTGIQVHNTWPRSWDIADAIPEDNWTKDGLYIGPTLTELRVPATWATRRVEAEGVRPHWQITPEFAAEWHHVVQPEVFLHNDWPQRMLTEAEFNSLVAPFSNVANTAALLVKRLESKGVELRYCPHMPPGKIVTDGGGVLINTHRGSHIRPAKADVSLWEKYLDHLIPSEREREHLKRWVATMIARPDIKMGYGVLLISEAQGVGKTTLGEKVLAPIIGRHNVSFPTERDITHSAFNGWAAHKRLAIINEIYAGSSSKAYNETKALITDRQIQINKKFVNEYIIENWLHILASSNSMKALKLSEEDRRWFVPRVTEVTRSAAWWTELNQWLLKGGLQAIAAWADEWVKENGAVEPGSIAPATQTKSSVINEGLSDAEQCVLALFEQLNDEHGVEADVVLADQAVIEYVAQQLYGGRRPDYMIKPLTVRKLARRSGWHAAEGKTGALPFKVRGLPSTILCRRADTAFLGSKTVGSSGRKPLDLQSVGISM